MYVFSDHVIRRWGENPFSHLTQRGILSPLTRDRNPDPGLSRWESRQSKDADPKVVEMGISTEHHVGRAIARHSQSWQNRGMYVFSDHVIRRWGENPFSHLTQRGILSPLTRDRNPDPGLSRWESRQSKEADPKVVEMGISTEHHVGSAIARHSQGRKAGSSPPYFLPGCLLPPVAGTYMFCFQHDALRPDRAMERLG